MPLFLLTLLPTALCSPICTLAPPPHSPHSTLVPCVVYRHLGLGDPTTVLKTHSCSFPFSFYFPHSLLFGFWRTPANKPPKVLVLSRTVWMCKWRRWTETVPWISTTDSYVLKQHSAQLLPLRWKASSGLSALWQLWWGYQEIYKAVSERAEHYGCNSKAALLFLFHAPTEEGIS